MLGVGFRKRLYSKVTVRVTAKGPIRNNEYELEWQQRGWRAVFGRL